MNVLCTVYWVVTQSMASKRPIRSHYQLKKPSALALMPYDFIITNDDGLVLAEGICSEPVFDPLDQTAETVKGAHICYKNAQGHWERL